MLIYIVIFMFVVALYFLERAQLGKNEMFRNVLFFCFIFVMIIFVGFRFELAGYDYFVYERQFNHTVSLTNLTKYNWESSNFYGYEWGYHLLSIVIKTFTDNFNIFLFIISILTITPLLFILKRYSTLVFIPIIIYLYKGFFYYNFTALRQLIAMTIFMFSLKFLFEKQYKKYTFGVICASLFHTSALILIFIIPFINRKTSKNVVGGIALLGGIVSFIPPITNMLISLVSNLASVIGMDRFGDTLSHGLGAINRLNMLEALVIISAVFILYDQMKQNKYFYQFLNLFLWYYAILAIFPNLPIMVRIRDYFLISFWILITYIMYAIKNKWLKEIVILMIISVSFVGYVRYIHTFDNGDMLNYKNYLFLQR